MFSLLTFAAMWKWFLPSEAQMQATESIEWHLEHVACCNMLTFLHLSNAGTILPTKKQQRGTGIIALAYKREPQGHRCTSCQATAFPPEHDVKCVFVFFSVRFVCLRVGAPWRTLNLARVSRQNLSQRPSGSSDGIPEAYLRASVASSYNML